MGLVDKNPNKQNQKVSGWLRFTLLHRFFGTYHNVEINSPQQAPVSKLG